MRANSEKIILDLCGGTGSWSKPYADAGYDVRVITMPRFDVTKFEYNDETAELIFHSTIGNDMVIYAPNVYGILAAPPCTMFSIARTKAKQPRDLRGSMAIVNACKKIVEHVMIATDMKMGFWAIENPRGVIYASFWAFQKIRFSNGNSVVNTKNHLIFGGITTRHDR